jgi:hypothetical protein
MQNQVVKVYLWRHIAGAGGVYAATIEEQRPFLISQKDKTFN